MDLETRAEALAKKLEERLGVRGRGLEAKLARAGRRLPRHVRAELGYIVEAQRLAENPKLARQIDWERIEAGAALAERHLGGIDPWERRRGLWLGWVTTNAFNIVVVFGLVVAVAVWRGLV